MSIRKILIAVDEQPASVRAAEVGAELARSVGGEGALIHVGDPGLIVIASHGRTGVTRALLGSVAEGVMRQAPCPVLVVRAQT